MYIIWLSLRINKCIKEGNVNLCAIRSFFSRNMVIISFPMPFPGTHHYITCVRKIWRSHFLVTFTKSFRRILYVHTPRRFDSTPVFGWHIESQDENLSICSIDVKLYYTVFSLKWRSYFVHMSVVTYGERTPMRNPFVLRHTTASLQRLNIYNSMPCYLVDGIIYNPGTQSEKHAHLEECDSVGRGYRLLVYNVKCMRCFHFVIYISQLIKFGCKWDLCLIEASTILTTM